MFVSPKEIVSLWEDWDKKQIKRNPQNWIVRPIIVNFSFIVISCTRSSMRHVVIIWLFGEIFERITTFCFVLSLYDKNRFTFTIYLFLYCLSCFVFLEPVFLIIIWKNFFLHLLSNNQLSCSILRRIFTMWAGDYERIINYDWPSKKSCVLQKKVGILKDLISKL